MNRKYVGMVALGLLVFVNLQVATIQADSTEVTITLSFSNLADAGEDHYEGWIIVDGSPVSTGKFNIATDGKLSNLDGDEITSFTVSDVELHAVTKFVLSLEPKGDTDSVPAAIKPLAGDLNTDKTSATLANNIGADFTGVSGAYILATPTNGADTNENSGIWWLDPTGAAPVAGLNLPDLTNTDWIYEGWVVIGGVPVTTGTFNTVGGVDDDDPFSGTEAGPPFPGEDFLVNAPTGMTFPTDIAGGVAVISIEPKMDNDPAPFQFKPLVGEIPAVAVDHTLYLMDDKTATMATGAVVFAENTASDEEDTPGFSLLATISLLGFAVVLRIQRRKTIN